MSDQEAHSDGQEALLNGQGWWEALLECWE